MASTITGSLGVDTSGNDFDDLGAVRTLIADEAHLAWRRLRMIGEIAARREAAAADGDDMLLLNGTTVLGAEVAAVMSVGKSTGSALVELALDARDRLPRVAGLLRDGLISFATFRTIVMQCTAVEDAESIAAIDADLAQELRDSGAVSWSTGKDTARRIVAEHDPDAVRDSRTARGKGVTVAHDGDESVLTVAADAEQVLLAKKAIDADAAALTCADDPRSVGARRSDLAIARLTGTTFGCTCGNPDCPAAATAAEIGERFATVIVHVIADATTLNGESTKAGWMDGYGVIDSHHAREIAARPGTVIRPLDLTATTARPADYRPGAAADTASRAVHGRCTVPGCNRTAWDCDLDHVTEFNHDRPAAGGPTCPCNLGPKCRFHHLVKTHVDGWLDDQITDANGVIWTETTTPSGHTIRARARNYWLLPGLGLLPCRHGAPTDPGIDTSEAPTRSKTRTQAKHAYRMRLRSRRRFARACAEAERQVEYDSAGPPPF
ncbi:HNH endonuclease signature motif containing protein [Gordonia malaquae]|uniref:HNH endonuclease signature motif containing protein n=1 Tax=Gordonia malaquae TaxID=410332 RepID=UPI0030FED723